MKLAAWAALSAASLLLACAPLTPAPPSAADLNDEVTSFLDRYLAAISARDKAAIKAAYTADDRLAWLEDGKVRYRRADDVLAGLDSLPASTQIVTKLSDLSVVQVGAQGAHAWASFQTTIGDGPRAFTFGGAISFVLEREKGSWRIVGGHTSSPTRR